MASLRCGQNATALSDGSIRASHFALSPVREGVKGRGREGKREIGREGGREGVREGERERERASESESERERERER